MDSVYVGPELSSEQKVFIDAILRNYPDGQVSRVEASEHTVDFSDREDFPGGLVTVHPMSATVHQDSLPLNAFTYLTVVPIQGKYTDDHFKGCEKLIHEACPQFSSDPPNLRCRSVESSGLDCKTWRPELGEDENAFAGVFRQTRGRDTKYFIAVQAGAPMAARQLREKIAKKGPFTFEQLLVDKDYNYAQYLAQRNCERIAYNVARALRVPVKNMADVGAYVTSEHLAQPRRALPLFEQSVSTIAPVGKQVGIFNRLTPVANAARHLFVYEGPYNGIAVFAMNGKARGLALPAHSGRLPEAQRTKLSPQEVEQRIQGMISEGANIRNHPDMVSDNYRAVAESEPFLESMQRLGWKQQSAMNNLVPVVLKLYDPSVKRGAK